MPGNKWKGYGDDWPEGHRLCLKCGVIKLFSEFHRHAACKEGYNTTCKSCRKPSSKEGYERSTLVSRIWYRAKGRAKRRGLEFNLDIDDIRIPKYCPVLKKELKVNTKYSPSIDRIDPLKGYTRDNIRIISNRANVLKSNATIEELRSVLEDLVSLKSVCEVVDIS